VDHHSSIFIQLIFSIRHELVMHRNDGCYRSLTISFLVKDHLLFVSVVLAFCYTDYRY